MLAGLLLIPFATAGADEPQPRITATEVGFEVEWSGAPERTFFPQTSNRLGEWQYTPGICFGDGDHSDSLNTDADAMFFRLSYVDEPVASLEEALRADFDGDGLSNEDEVAEHGCDPLVADTDGDGLPDGWEVAHRLNPTDDGSGDPARGPNAVFGSAPQPVPEMSGAMSFGGIIGSPGGLSVGLESSSVSVSGGGPSYYDAYMAGVLAEPEADFNDRDGDGHSDADDAAPLTRSVALRSASGPPQMVFREFENWDSQEHGFPYSINNACQVACGKAVWSGGAWFRLGGVPDPHAAGGTLIGRKIEIDGNRHELELQRVSGRTWIDRDGRVLANGVFRVVPITGVDEETGEEVTVNPGVLPEFALVWDSWGADPEIVGHPVNQPIVGRFHRELGTLAKDGTILLRRKRFKDGLPTSNDFSFSRLEWPGYEQESQEVVSPSMPQTLASGGVVSWSTYDFALGGYRPWVWLPNASRAWTLHSTIRPTRGPLSRYAFPSIIGELPGGVPCLGAGGRSFVLDGFEWRECPSLDAATMVTRSGIAYLRDTQWRTHVWRFGHSAPLFTRIANPGFDQHASWTVLDANDDGIALVRVRAPGFPDRYGLLCPGELLVDHDRDGVVAVNDHGAVWGGDPWRWWVNDDDDLGDLPNGELPDVPGAGVPDHADDRIDGIRDLVDFFMVWPDLRELLKVFPKEQFDYVLNQELTTIRYLALPDIDPTGAVPDRSIDAHLRSISLPQELAGRVLATLPVSGRALSPAFLEQAERGLGALLVECVDARSSPIQLEIRQGENLVAVLELPLRAIGVESMYRHVDLTQEPKFYSGSEVSVAPSSLGTRTTPSTGMDDDTDEDYFVFLHGFNVSAEKARGWHAEFFKRLYQLGSRKRFVGVTWNGATGIPGPTADIKNTDYHRAVFFAFQTGLVLPEALSFIGDADFTIAAHSLGNVVVSNAIEDAGLTPNAYHLINAAVPREAYGVESIFALERLQMTHEAWDDYAQQGQQRLFASNWHTLFEEDDARAELTWRDRFEDVTASRAAYNFYSPGDDVVMNPDFRNGSLWDAALSLRGLVRGAWAAQEFVKGRNDLPAKGQSRTQGGWGFNGASEPLDPSVVFDWVDDPAPPWGSRQGYWKLGFIPGTWRLFTPEEARDEITDEDLHWNPFFEVLRNGDLFDPDTAEETAGRKWVQYDLLARGIPASSFAAASNAVPELRRNFNMEAMRTSPGHWPVAGHFDEDARGRILHSDIKDVALNHVFKVYEAMLDPEGYTE